MATITPPTPARLAESQQKVRHPLQRLRNYIRLYVSLEGASALVLFLALWFWIGLALDYGFFKAFAIDWVQEELPYKFRVLGWEFPAFRTSLLLVLLAGTNDLRTTERLETLTGKRKREDEATSILRKQAFEKDKKSLIEMFTPTFPSLEKLFKQLRKEPQSVRVLRPGVPAAVEAVILRLMAKDREQRFQEPAELAQELGALLAGGGGGRQTAAAREEVTTPTTPAATHPMEAAAASEVAEPHRGPALFQHDTAGDLAHSGSGAGRLGPNSTKNQCSTCCIHATLG